MPRSTTSWLGPTSSSTRSWAIAVAVRPTTRWPRSSSASGPPHGRILSLDLPSGLDPDSGEASEPSIRAAATLTLALPKRGLLTEAGRERAGDLYLADIGLPAALYERIGLAVETPFATGRIVRLEA